MLNAALAFAASGCSVVPASMNGSKAPIKAWKQYQSQRANALDIAAWYKDGTNTGLGVITGAVSGNLEMLELEGRAVASGLLDEVREIAINSGLGQIWQVINDGYVEMTPSGGLHWLYRIADREVPGNTKLARRPGENGGVDVLAETRGEGGFVVVAPSHGTVHPSGRPWILIKGSPALIPTLSWDEREALHLVFRALDAMPQVETVREHIEVKSESDNLTPGTDYNNRGSWDELLLTRGWVKVYTANGTTYWRRPGKDTGISATTGRNDGDNLFVFSTSTEFESERPYSKFAALALLEHGGDFKAAARELRRRGYGSIAAVPTPSLAPAQTAPAEGDANENENGEPRERTSWWPRQLDLTGGADEPEPEFLPREDGQRLLYRGKVNGLLGESESGKTWLALYAVQQTLAVGQRVIYLDFEDSAKGILSRLKALGAIEPHFDGLLYANPDETLGLAATQDLYASLVDFNPDLIVLDGVNAAMTLLGLDLTSNTDATKFSQWVLKPLKKHGAGVLTIDHVPKSKENRGNYAIGAQAKRADIDGAAIAVEVMAPFGRGTNGELKLTVTKDRPGHVRAISLGARAAGVAHLRSQGEDQIRIAIQPLKTANPFRPTHLMDKVSRLLEASKAPLSKAAVEKEIEGKREAIRQACQVLVEEGYIEVTNGARNSLMLSSVKQYREADDPSSDGYAWTRPVDNFEEN